MSRFLSVVIKPTLACNMVCRHCYHSAEELSSSARISFERLEHLFSAVSKEYDSVWFVWHGGEPLSLPFSFFRKAIEMAFEQANAGGAVLLSPSCASFDMFHDYEERGRIFKDIVNSLESRRA